MLNQVKITALVLVAIGVAIPIAHGHPRLKVSIPASGATVASSPRQIKIGFNEPLIGPFTGLKLSDAKGRQIQTGAPILDPQDKTSFMVPVRQRLIAGTYNVSWHAVSVDTHRVTGSYSFKVSR